MALLLPVVNATSAQAAPAWHIDSVSNATAAPNSSFGYFLLLSNVGDTNSSGPITLSGHLPPGFTAEKLRVTGLPNTVEEVHLGECEGSGGGPFVGATDFTCTLYSSIRAHTPRFRGSYHLDINVGAGAGPTSVATFEISGGGASAPASTVDPTRITSEPPPFGIDAFDAGLVDAAGATSTTAAAHPYADLTALDFNTRTDPKPIRGELWPAEPARDGVADLPPGLVGATAGLETCTIAQLATSINNTPLSLCPPASQIGTATVRANPYATIFVDEQVPLFNMVPSPNAPAEFGFSDQGVVVTLTARLRSSGDYGLSVSLRGIPEGVPVAGSSFDFWGVPSDPSHEGARSCPGEAAPWRGGPICASPAEPRPFFRNPTSCSGPLPTAFHTDSWEHPGSFDANGEPDLSDPNWRSASSLSHEAPGYPYPAEPGASFPAGYSGPTQQGAPVGFQECENIPFEPEVEIQPSTDEAESPTGLAFDLRIPQSCWEAQDTAAAAEGALCQSDLERAEVTLPQGMSVNPAASDGLTGCTAAQIGLLTPEGSTPIHFDEADPSCPESSKIGSVDIESPLIEEHLTGAVYLAAQNDNPFKSLLALYIVGKSNGVIVKLPGHLEILPDGRLKTVVDELPQLPFTHMHLAFKSGSRAPLINPPTCGQKTTETELTPWSGNGAVSAPSSFTLTKGPGGSTCPATEAAMPFAPRLDAGTTNPAAGATSPFTLHLTRSDGEQRFASLDTTTPPGLSAYLTGVPYCPESALSAAHVATLSGAGELATPSCPAASQVGTADSAAGAGVTPFHVPGKVYLAGPYQGAPLSLAIFVPALAGPLDLGDVLVRAPISVDPASAQITVKSGSLPTALQGIPLDLRALNVSIDRPHFIVNPTSCEEMAVAATVKSTLGATSSPSSRFQLLGCEHLPFKPKLSFRFSGATKRTGHPALHATLVAKPGEAGIAKVAVALPNTEILDNAHINSPCTRVQFAQNACPSGSVLGHARAITPLLDQPLEGPVYLMTGFGHTLPDLVADLGGQIHVVLDGRVDTNKAGGLRNTFEAVPDAPVSKFTISLAGGHKGLLQNTTDICARPIKASVQMDAHNGKTHDTSPVVSVKGCGGGGKGKGHKRRAHHGGHR